MKLGISRIVISVVCLAAGAMMALAGCATSAKAEASAGKTAAPSHAVEDAATVPTAEIHAPIAPPVPAEAAVADAEPAEDTDVQYRLGPGDVLFFKSLNDESLSGEVVVRYDGCISLPLIPDIKVENATRDEATELLCKAYEAEFVDPRLSLSVKQSRSKSFYVMGDVARPGQQQYERPLTLLDAVNLAGGLRVDQRSNESFVASQGQLTKAFLIRHRAGERKVIEINLRGLSASGGHPSDAPVYPGDVVYIPEAVNLVYILGEVRRPSAYELNEHMTLLHLLALAGGVMEGTGRKGQAVVLHETDPQNTRVELVDIGKILKTGQDMSLRPGDIVYVPRKRLVLAADFIKQLQSVISPSLGMYMQAYDAYYTDTRYRQLTQGASGDASLLTIEQTLRAINALSGLAPGAR